MNDENNNETSNPQLLLMEQIKKEMVNRPPEVIVQDTNNSNIDYIYDDTGRKKVILLIGVVILMFMFGIFSIIYGGVFAFNKVKHDYYYISNIDDNDVSIVFFEGKTCRFNNNFLMNCKYEIKKGKALVDIDVNGFFYRLTYKLVDIDNIILKEVEVKNVKNTKKKYDYEFKRSDISLVEKEYALKNTYYIDDIYRKLKNEYNGEFNTDKLDIKYLYNKSSLVKDVNNNKCAKEYYYNGFALYDNILYGEINPSSSVINPYLVYLKIMDNVREVYTFEYGDCGNSYTFALMNNGTLHYINNFRESSLEIGAVNQISDDNNVVADVKISDYDGGKVLEIIYKDGSVDINPDIDLGLN